ncbi:antiterminator Q family protein [Erwinia mallotivora]|uniref:antiterminator Q family protein n=1 Tax=Erwinia mallotivora TaxID=69222 RepID=UPI0035E4FD50
MKPQCKHPCIPPAAGFKGLLPENASDVNCTDNDAMIVDACPGRLKQKRPDEYASLVDHCIKDISKRVQGRKLKLSQGIIIRIKFQMAEGFIGGCLSMLEVELEMENTF